MKVKCVGKKCGAFTNDNGDYLQYAKVMCVYPMTQVDDGVNKAVGDEVSPISIPFDYYDSIPAEPCELDIEFNQKGKVIGVDLL